MDTLKEQVKSSLDNLPEDATVDDIIEHVRFVNKIHRGLEQVEKGEVVSHKTAGEILRGERTLDD